MLFLHTHTHTHTHTYIYIHIYTKNLEGLSRHYRPHRTHTDDRRFARNLKRQKKLSCRYEGTSVFQTIAIEL